VSPAARLTPAGSAGRRPELAVLKPGDWVGGRYLVQRVISGGMGHVYIAYHKGWRRKIAIKCPNRIMLSSERLFARILREANAWIEMGLHPNIAYCYFVRNISDVPHIFVEFVDGGNLRTYMSRHSRKEPDFKAAIDMAIQFCHGMAFAHAKGLIHRDIKPENILMTRDGIVKITDFGIVRFAGDSEDASSPEGAASLTGDDDLTRADTAMGTPNYMSPEQRRDARSVDHRSDIFSFGVCLYELFCGIRPDLGDPDNPPDPAHIGGRADFPTGLARLIRACVHKDPDHRPPDFTDLRNRLHDQYRQLFRADSPYADLELVPAETDGLNNRGVSCLELGRHDAARACFETAQAMDGFHPQVNWNLGLVHRLNESLAHARHGDETVRLMRHLLTERGMAEAAVEAAIQDAIHRRDMAGLVARRLDGVADRVNALAFSPDGRVLAVGSSDGAVSLFPMEPKGALRLFSEHTHAVIALAFSADGSALASADGDHRIRVFDVAEGVRRWSRQDHADLITGLCFSPDSRRLVSVSLDGRMRFHDSGTGQPLSPTPAACAAIHAAAFSPGGRSIAVGTADGEIRMHPAEGDGPPAAIKAHDAGVTALAFSTDGALLASGGRDGAVAIWSGSGDSSLAVLTPCAGAVTSLVFSPDGHFLLAGCTDHAVYQYDALTPGFIKSFPAHGGEVTALAFSPDGTCFASGSRDRTVRIWHSHVCDPQLTPPRGYADLIRHVRSRRGLVEEMRTCIRRKKYSEAYDGVLKSWAREGYGRLSPFYELFEELSAVGTVRGIASVIPFNRLRVHKSPVVALQFSSDGARLSSADRDGGVRVWDVAAGEVSETFEIKPDAGSVLVFSSDGTLMACAGESTAIYDLEGKRAVRALWGHTRRITSLAFSPDGRVLASGGEDRTACLWSLADGRLLHRFGPHPHGVTAMAFSGHGDRLAIETGPVITVWDARTGETVAAFPGHKLIFSPLAFSPEGPRLAAAGRDNAILIHDVDSRETALSIEMHENPVAGMAFFPDGERLITASGNGSLRIWDGRSGRLIHRIAGHTPHLGAVAVSPDGRFIASESLDFGIAILRIIPDLQFDGDMSFFTEKQEEIHLSQLAERGKPDTAYRRLTDIISQSDDGGGWRHLPLFARLLAQGRPAGPRRVLPFHAFRGHTSYVSSLTFDAAGDTLISGSWDQTIQGWNMRTGENVCRFTAHRDHVTTLAISPDSRLLASGSRNGTVRIWDCSSCRPVTALHGHGHAVASLWFINQGKLLVSSDRAGMVVFWDVKTCRPVRRLHENRNDLGALAFSADGNHMALAVGEEIRCISLAGRKRLVRLRGHARSVSDVAFSPDRRLLASAGADQTARIWSVADAEMRLILREHEDMVRSVSFSPDGATLATGGDDAMVRIWDVETGSLTACLEGHTGSVTMVRFSPDGRFLSSAGEDNAIRLWIIAPDLDFASNTARS